MLFLHDIYNISESFFQAEKSEIKRLVVKKVWLRSS